MEQQGVQQPAQPSPELRASRLRVQRHQTSTRKFRGLTCANCRARKVRCEGGQPTCKTCEVYGDGCRYDKAPPMSQILALAKRLQEAERVIEEFRSPVLHEENPLPSGGLSERNVSPQPPTLTDNIQSGMTSNLASKSWPEAHQKPNSIVSGQVVNPTTGSPATADLSIDEHGNISYYGPTSAVHDPPPAQIESAAFQTNVTYSNNSTAKMRNSLASYAREMALWEGFSLRNGSLQTGIPQQLMCKLLHIYWTWVSPMFMWVYRPAFIRDMATGGRYYSEFLLIVICAHAAKYQDGNSAELLLARARRLLGTAIQQPSSIPTVQALLQLSARDLAQGSISQAWVYSGIAFRMASDLGLQHSNSEVKGLGPVDLEIRRRLFWGCYFWDKATSLYAGRLPAVTEQLDCRTLDLLDTSTDIDMWTPYFSDVLNLSKTAPNDYEPRRGYAVSCFVNSCKLSIIINDIIIQLYHRQSRAITEVALKDIKFRLDRWRAQSPPHLRYEPDSLPPVCPPPHLISQNLLYFASVILAHRPFWAVPTHYQVCISASQSIEKLVILMDSTFGLENVTYLMGYCIYTGASAILEDAKQGKVTAHATLQTFLHALNSGIQRCPLLGRSLNIIIKGMNTAPSQQSAVANSMNRPITSATTNSYIPAFPYIDPSAPFDFEMNPYTSGTNLDSMAVLDCFPEMQIDLSEFIDPLQ